MCSPPLRNASDAASSSTTGATISVSSLIFLGFSITAKRFNPDSCRLRHVKNVLYRWWTLNAINSANRFTYLIRVRTALAILRESWIEVLTAGEGQGLCCSGLNSRPQNETSCTQSWVQLLKTFPHGCCVGRKTVAESQITKESARCWNAPNWSRRQAADSTSIDPASPASNLLSLGP